MKPFPTLLLLTLLAPASEPARGQHADRELHGELFSIEKGEQNPTFLPGVRVTVREFGNSALTNDQGRFRIPLPAAVLPGQEVTLRHDKTGYAICSPLFGKQLVPALPTTVVEIRMLPAGSKLFWTHERIEEFLTRTADESAKQFKGPHGGETDLSPYIQELGRHYGFTPDEIRREIGQWMETARTDLTDFRKQGMVAFAEKNFRLAGEHFGRSADEQARQGAEKFRTSAQDRELSGDSYSNALDFGQALQAYQTALKALNVYHDGLGDLGLKAYPEYAADVQNLSFKVATVKSNLGIRVAGPDSHRYLEEAIQAYQGQIAQIPKVSDPQGWARIQNDLGNALASLGERQGGTAGAPRLAEAVQAYREALTVYTRNALPQDWATTQNNLGNALASLGERQGGAAGVGRLAEAVQAYREALTVRTPDHLPQDWARTQDNLGIALVSLGERQGGAAGAPRLDEAVQAYREALTVFTRDDLPQDWATTQNNLGIALASLGRRQGGAEGVGRLDEAVAAYREALTIRTRDHLPQQWARTQNNLGAALQGLGERQGSAAGAGRLTEAVAAYREALTVFTRDDLPQQWALTQNNLGAALMSLGEQQGGAAGAGRLAEAVQAYQLALTVFTRQGLSQQWAMTQHNLGNALASLGEQQGGAAGAGRLAEAVQAYQLALTVRTRQGLPQQWARTQSNLGNALQTQIRLHGFPKGLEQVDRLSQAEGLRDDPVAQASLQTLALVGSVAAERHAEASRTFTNLVALVERQPDDFHLVWDWTPLRELLAESKVPALATRRASLQKLIDAVARENKAAILAGLKELQAAFRARAEGPKKPAAP
jgi:tetratricopeptide (TPR) repeat protein